MNKKLAASLTIAIFLLSTIAILAPVQAHFTLGQNVPNYPYTTQNFDPHVQGIVGYVWPGGGEDAYDGSPTGSVPGSLNLAGPGYVAPYPLNALTAAKVYPSPWTQNFAQEDGDEYAPSGAIVTGTTGDLIFAVNYTDHGSGLAAPQGLKNQAWDYLYIAIPPEFTVPGPEQIVTTISNTANKINVYKANPYDRYVPGWTIIGIGADNMARLQFNKGQWYYVRINGVTAPTIAGKYFFKMLLYYSATGASTWAGGPGFFGGSAPAMGANPGSSTAQYNTGYGGTCAQPCYPRIQYWVPTQNWPVLLVKGELDPAIITGTIRYGGYNATNYGQPIQEAGMVTAVMTTKLDPYTGAKLTGPLTNAMGYFNGTYTNSTGNGAGTYGADGHYEVEGVAPGIYNLYASAAGYPQTLIASNVQVLKGQSLHFDGYLNPGPVIHGDVYSKHAFGSEPWPYQGDTQANVSPDANGKVGGEYVKVEIYDKPTVNNVPSSNASLVSWSPLPCVAGGQNMYYPGNDQGVGTLTYGQGAPYEGCGDPRMVAGSGPVIGGNYMGAQGFGSIVAGNGLAFPWHEWNGNLAGSTGSGTGAGGVYNSFYPMGTDPQGVGPAQTWFVQSDGVNDKFHYEFGDKGMFGAPTTLDGHVPQVYATWVNGLTAGRYYVRAWVFRYVQTALDGSTFQEYSFQVTPNEWAGDISIPLDLRISSWINKTVHFHDNAGTLATAPISTGARYIAGGLYDANNVLYSYNVTTTGVGYVYANSNAARVAAGYLDGYPYPGYNPLDKFDLNRGCVQTGNCNIQYWGFNDTWLGQDYGIPAGTYTPKVYALGYIQQTFDKVSVTLSGTPISVSNHLYRGVGFNFTVFSIDWERPRVNRQWVWPGQDISIGIFNAQGNYAGEVCYICYATSTSFSSSRYTRSGLWSPPVQNATYFTPSSTVPAVPNWGTSVNPSVYAGGSYYTEFNGTGSSLYGSTAHSVWFGLDVGGASTIYAKVGGQESTQARTFTTGSAKNTWQLSFYFPTAYDSGQYSFQGWTYGYIQDKDYTIYANKGQVADMKINMLIGVNVSLDIIFKKEHLVIGTPYNMSARVRLFDDSGRLVAEWMTSQGVYTSPLNLAADNGGPSPSFTVVPGHVYAADGSFGRPFDDQINYIPGGTTELHVLMAGLGGSPSALYGPGAPNYGEDLAGASNGFACGTAGWWTRTGSQSAAASCITPSMNSASNSMATYGDPVFTANGGSFRVNKWPIDYWSTPKAHFPNEGILGQPDYTGTGWTAEIDTVNWYLNDSQLPLNPFSVDSGFLAKSNGYWANYYPVVPGVAMGESFHIIPGTAATSKISYTEDGALDPYNFVTVARLPRAHSMAPNHLGPYSQEGVWTFTNAPLSGETSAIWEVDLNGYISGTALAFTWSNEFRSISWYSVTVQGAAVGNATGPSFASYTEDGVYEFYLLPGTYSMSMSGPGYRATPMGTISVTSGQSSTPGTGNNVGLPQSNIPVPEFSGIAVVALSALAASLYLLRRRRQ